MLDSVVGGTVSSFDEIREPESSHFVRIRSLNDLDVANSWRRLLWWARRRMEVADRLPFEVVERIFPGGPTRSRTTHNRRTNARPNPKKAVTSCRRNLRLSRESGGEPDVVATGGRRRPLLVRSLKRRPGRLFSYDDFDDLPASAVAPARSRLRARGGIRRARKACTTRHEN